jgi:hypothetical protein
MGWRPLGAALVGLAWALNPLSIAFATGGMETSLFVLVALVALSLGAAGTHPVVAAGLAGLATLVRPEGALLAAVIVGWTWTTRRLHGAVDLDGTATSPSEVQSRGQGLACGAVPRDLRATRRAALASAELIGTFRATLAATVSRAIWRAALSAVPRATWQAALAAAVPMAIAGVTLLVCYGSPLPNSVAAKQVAYSRAWPLENAVALLVQAGLPGWSTYLLATLPTATGLLIAACGLVGLALLIRRGVRWLNDQSLAWQPFAAFAALYLAFYVVVGLRGVRLFPWYLVPIEPFYVLGAAAGLASLLTRTSSASRLDASRAVAWRFGSRRPGSWRPGSWHSAAWLGAWRSSSWLAALLVIWQLPALDWHQPLLPAGEALGREQLLLDVGRRLAETLPPTAVVAAPEIGALGYASNLHILDTVGLVSPDALPYYPLPAEQLVTDNAISAKLILDKQPDVIVTLDAFAQRSLLTDATFQRDYQLERAYPASVWQSAELLVFRRANPKP